MTEKVSFSEKIKLDQISQMSLPVWPLLWGFFIAEEPSFAHIAPAVLFIVLLRWMFYSAIEMLSGKNEELSNHTHTIQTIVAVILTLVTSYFLGGVVMFLLVLWLIAFGINHTIYKTTWWPHVSYGVLFGAFPVLFGNAASQDMSLAFLFPTFAAFFWVTALETMRSGTALDTTKSEHLTVVKDILGHLKISYAGVFFALSLAFLVITGLYTEAHGLYYAGLMVAEAIMLISLRGVTSQPDKACARFYTHSAYASVIVCFTFILL